MVTIEQVGGKEVDGWRKLKTNFRADPSECGQVVQLRLVPVQGVAAFRS